MCGILAGIAPLNVTPVIPEGLHWLEYRDNDSAGLAVLKKGDRLLRVRTNGDALSLQQYCRSNSPSATALFGGDLHRLGQVDTRL